MGGRQQGVKSIEENSEATAKDVAVVKGKGKRVLRPKSLPKQAENITAGIMQLHKPEVVGSDELRALRQLSDVRIDDPRVISLSPADPRLVLDKFKVRKESDRYFIERLQKSMVEEGQQRVIIVAPRGEELWVVAGNTRLRAARLGKKIEKIYVLSVELTDKQAWFLALQSNLDNSLPMDALNDEEQGTAILRLTEEYGMTQEQVAELIHRDQSWVSRQIRLAKVNPDVEQMVKKELISESHATLIMTLPKRLQSQLADHVADEELTVQETQKLANNLKIVLKDADGLPEELLDEEILGNVLSGGVKPEKAAQNARAVSAGLKLLHDEIRDMDYGQDSEFAESIIEKNMDPKTAEEFAKSLNLLWDEASTVPEESRETLIGRLVSGNFSLEHRNLASVFEDAREAIKVTQVATESKGLPKPIRELIAKEFEGPSWSSGRNKVYTIEEAKELVSRLESVFEVAKPFPDGVQAKLAARITQKKMSAKTGEALARTIEAVIQEAKEIKSKKVRSELLQIRPGVWDSSMSFVPLEHS